MSFLKRSLLSLFLGFIGFPLTLYGGDNVLSIEEPAVPSGELLTQCVSPSEITISEMKAHLTTHIIGEDAAMEALAVYVGRHYKTLQLNSRFKKNPTYLPIKKMNLLLAGQTGSGKTASIRQLAEFLKVPFFEGDSTSFSKTGYIGANVSSMVEGLLKVCSYDNKHAEQGIIFIDEIDKIAARETIGSRDISGNDVQEELLKMMEGKEVPVKQKIDEKQVTHMVDTKNILFIGGGAFTKLTEKKEKKLNISDFVKIGFKPEFLGRFGKVIYFEGTTKEKLCKILKSPQVSPIREAKILMKFGYNIEVIFILASVDLIAENALKLKTGVRGITSIINQLLEPIISNSEKYKGGKFEITSEIIKSYFPDSLYEREEEPWMRVYI